MITAQDIREKTFEKAVFGGYDMATVDAFLEEVAGDLTLLQKENAVLKDKLKVLANKVQEYRSNEEALNQAVLSAQKMGSLMERDAKEKADAILSEARAEAARITGSVSTELAAEQARLEETRASSVRMIDNMEMLCRRQLEFLQKMGELDFVKQLRQEQSGGAFTPAPASAPAPAQAGPAEQPDARVFVPQSQQSAPAAVQAQPVQAPAPTVVKTQPQAAPAEIHETVKTIGETVAKAMDEPVINVRPGMSPAVVDDERPTRSFNIVSDPDDAADRSVPFMLDDLK